MGKKDFSSNTIEEAKRSLGDEIKKCHKGRSLRNLADAVGLSPSNLTYIEQGRNAPTAEVYEKLIAELHPSPKQQAKMDQQYMLIRQVPPPDVCRAIMDNGLTPTIRELGNQPLTDAQKQKLSEVLASFKIENERGEKENV